VEEEGVADLADGFARPLGWVGLGWVGLGWVGLGWLGGVRFHMVL
jgi:hypothetical protein